MMNNPNSEKSLSSMVTDGSLMIFQILFLLLIHQNKLYSESKRIVKKHRSC